MYIPSLSGPRERFACRCNNIASLIMYRAFWWIPEQWPEQHSKVERAEIVRTSLDQLGKIINMYKRLFDNKGAIKQWTTKESDKQYMFNIIAYHCDSSRVRQQTITNWSNCYKLFASVDICCMLNVFNESKQNQMTAVSNGLDQIK
jgi:hypothetical protein